jgi:hypothetical protein
MGIERAKVVEVHAETSAAGSVGSGYLVGDGLVLACARNVGRRGPTAVRPASTGPWLPASVVWRSNTSDAALLEVDDGWAPPASPAPVRWGEVGGAGPVGVTASGFPPADVRPERFRDPQQFYGRVSPVEGSGRSLAVTATTGGSLGDGMSGAALFAGADLVGVLVVDTGRLHAIPARALVEDEAFAGLVAPEGGLRLAPVQAPSLPLPILQMP